MKNRFSSLFCIALIFGAVLAFTDAADAQNAPGLYSFFSGGTLPIGSSNQYTNSTSTNTWGAAGTSTNFIVNVSTFDYAGVTITGAGKGTTTNLVKLFKSFDNGTTFEATASFRYAESYTSGTVTTDTAAIDIHGVTHLALVMGPVGDANITNAAVTINLKSPLIFSTAPGNQGRTGTPITVPNFP